MTAQTQPPAEAPANDGSVPASGPATPPGGGFLTRPVPEHVFTREQLDEDVCMLAEEIDRFWEEQVLGNLEKIENKAEIEVDGARVPIAVHLLRKVAELGLLAVDLPEEYGGLEADKRTSGRVAECLRGCSSMAVTIGAHAGIGTLPIVYFGTEEQKAKWLPKLATAELVSCYALTEPGAGSDALAGKSTAQLVRGEDGEPSHYELTGEKIWISNGGWADVAIVFARLDGAYSAFIVDLNQPGVSRGAEEKKMGILGSSTTTLSFDRARVELDAMLGKPGDAPKIAFNILYLGRLKLGIGDLGSCKYTIDRTIAFGRERKQFGQPVITFGMQKAKLAEMVWKTFALDALCYRVLGAIDDAIEAAGGSASEIAVLRRFGLETSAIKILGSETLMRVANHAVRMHGGYGFSAEYHVERVMRDNVVDTIFEGTNDINRLVLYGELTRGAYGGTLELRPYLERVHAALRSGRLAAREADGPFADLVGRVEGLKRAFAYVLERTLIGVGKDVRVRQQPMAALSDGVIALYAAESALVRARMLAAQQDCATDRKAALEACARLAVAHAAATVEQIGECALAHLGRPGETGRQRSELGALLAIGKRAVDRYTLEDVLATFAIEQGRYPF
ncbi:MAG: acyl-CoA dehydrogenase [Planctomycetota bacterium]|nr:MAG: acyl-CoA dehydrogenase [Planctomycetota bacterium]